MSAANQPMGHFQGTTDAATAKSMATLIGAAIPGGANWVRISHDVACRYRDDGTAPTASVGISMQATYINDYNGDLSTLQVISQSGTATYDLSFYAGSPNV